MFVLSDPVCSSEQVFSYPKRLPRGLRLSGRLGALVPELLDPVDALLHVFVVSLLVLPHPLRIVLVLHVVLVVLGMLLSPLLQVRFTVKRHFAVLLFTLYARNF